jgi:ribose transport system permease protein
MKSAVETKPTKSAQPPPSHDAAEATASYWRRPLRSYLEAWAFPALLVAAFIFFAVFPRTSASFTSPANLRTLVSSNSVLAIVALAALIPLVCYEFDLSVGATAGLSSVFVATTLSSGTPILLGIAVGVGLGLLVGTINALLVTRVGVNAVITTLGIGIILDGVANQKTSGIAVTGNIPLSFLNFGSSNWLGIPKIAVVLALLAIAIYYVLDYTPYGRYLYAFWSNRTATRLVGVRTKLTLGLTFVIGGVLAGLAGVLQVAYAGSADPRVGDNFTLPALAAAFLSAAAIRPGRYNVWGTLVAVFFLAVLNNGLTLAGSPAYVANYVNGMALIIGVGLAVQLGGRREI